MPRSPLEPSFFIILGLAITAAGIPYWKDPGLPLVGARTGLSMIWFVLPRMIPALILAGMLQVLVPQETVSRYFGHQSGFTAILLAIGAGRW